MTYVVDENCIRCKLLDCVEVCPVSCFYEGANMVVINDEECIDCGVCEPACPIGAIKPDTVPGIEHMAKHNAQYAKIWWDRRITKKKSPPEDWQEWDGKPHKLETAFDPTPGEGDD